MEPGQIDTITKLADAFKASGPFLFSILLGAAWLWTIKKAIDVYKDRSGSGGLRLTLLSFAAFFVVSSVVVGWRAIDWWLETQDSPFGRYATIVRVPNDITVWADAVPLYQQKLEAQRSPTHSLRLAFLFKSHCPDADVLILQMNREGMQKPDTFRLNCNALDSNWQTRKTFDLDVDEKGTLVLKNITAPEGPPTKVEAPDAKRFALISEAVAGAMPIMSSTKRSYELIRDPAELQQAAAVLQSSSAPPGAKLEALGHLQASVDVLKGVMVGDAFNKDLSEPLYATLLDLQRHSDRQLARKAQLLLADLPLADDMARLAASPAGRNQLSLIIESMSAEDLAQARQKAQAGGHTVLAARLGPDAAQKKIAPPIPTYTRDGDRFFVKGTWDNTDEKAVQCIGKAYYANWGGTSLKQQTDLVRTRTTRTVYYTKAWSRDMLRMLQACGAAASYVAGIAENPEAPLKALK